MVAVMVIIGMNHLSQSVGVRRIQLPKLHIVIDTREKLPYTFERPPKGYKIVTVHKKLDVGDYALLGYEDRACVERKTKADLFGTVGRRSPQFVRNLIRMRAMVRSWVAIEEPRQSILKGPDYYMRRRGKAGLTKYQYGQMVCSKVRNWSIEHNIPFYFFDSRQQSEAWVLQFLIKLRGCLDET